MALIKEQAEIVDGEIRAESDFAKLSSLVQSGNILVLEDAFPSEEIVQIRDQVVSWGQNTPELITDPGEADSSFHRIDKNPEESSCPHIFHSFNFDLGQSGNGGIEDEVRPYFEKLRRLQNQLAETDAAFDDKSEPSLHPQVIQYPIGGGGFSMHQHTFLPQKVGLILSLSEYGTDFESGGTRFATPADGVVDIEGEHTIGDIAVFRYDLPHEVTPCDPEKELDFGLDAGRWSMILPYY
jgi:hypothetical protein